MADIDKKINLVVDSNAKDNSKDFDKLNKSIKEVTDNFSKLTKLANNKGLVTGLKNITKEVNELNKGLFNLGGMSKVLNDVQTKMDKLNKALNKSNRSGSRGPYKKSPQQAAKEAARLERIEQERLKEQTVKYNDIKAELDAAKEKRYTDLKNFGRDEAFKQFGTSALDITKQLFKNKSIIGTLSAVASSVVGAMSTRATTSIGKRYAGQYLPIEDRIADMQEFISRPGTSADTIRAGKEFIKSQQKEKLRLQGEEAKEKGKVAGKAAVAAAVISLATTALSKFSDTVKSTTGITVSLKENFANLIQSIGSITSLQGGAATYMVGSTLYTNPTARTQQMKYGLTNSQNYALSRTMTMMNLQSDEDLMYMNKNQVQLFSSMMQKYSSWYDKMESSGVLTRVQEMQMDLQMFREELAMDFMEWFSENKDTILNAVKNIAKFVMQIADVVVKATGWFGQGISWLTGQSSSTLSETMSNATSYSNASITRGTSKTNNINITMTNTATGVLSDQSQMENFFSEQLVNTFKDAVASLDE